jgi:hypothetical protein
LIKEIIVFEIEQYRKVYRNTKQQNNFRPCGMVDQSADQPVHDYGKQEHIYELSAAPEIKQQTENHKTDILKSYSVYFIICKERFKNNGDTEIENQQHRQRIE